MSQLTSISLGILIVDWDEQGKDYISSFIPLVVECIKLVPENVVAEVEIYKILQSEFGLKLPLSVIGALLRRCLREQYLERDGKNLVKNHTKLNDITFQQRRQSVIYAHNQLVKDFIKFAHKHYDVEFSETGVESILIDFLEKHQLNLLRDTLRGTSISNYNETVDPSNKYIFAKYVTELLQKDDSGPLRHLVTLTKASMLANAIYLPEVNQSPLRNWRTKVYLDTALLIYALGYAGRVYQDPALQLLQLLYSIGAELYCFSHNFEEIRNSLLACAHIVRSGNPPKGSIIDSVHFFVSKNYSPTRIELIAETLENELSKINVRVVEKPNRVKQYQISEDNLRECLEGKMNFASKRSLNNDIDSIASMQQIWKSKSYSHLEHSPGVFVTTNYRLVQATREFYQDNDFLNERSAFPIVTDYTLTNLLWLRNPREVPDLPRKQILAYCYAATKPNDSLWEKYLTEIEINQELDEEQRVILLHTQEARSELMELVVGQEQLITRGTVLDVLEKSRESMNQEHSKQLALERKGRETAELKEASRKSLQRSRAQRYARRVRKISEITTIFLALVVSLYLIPWNLIFVGGEAPELKSHFLRLLVGTVIFIFGVPLNLINQFYGTPIETLLQKGENYLAVHLEKWLLNFAGFDETETG